MIDVMRSQRSAVSGLDNCLANFLRINATFIDKGNLPNILAQFCTFTFQMNRSLACADFSPKARNDKFST